MLAYLIVSQSLRYVDAPVEPGAVVRVSEVSPGGALDVRRAGRLARQLVRVHQLRMMEERAVGERMEELGADKEGGQEEGKDGDEGGWRRTHFKQFWV